MRDDRAWLKDMAESIKRIEEYAVRGRQAFEDDPLIQSWITTHIQYIGEAARSLSADFRRRHTRWPWKEMIGMRHALVHRYFSINADLVWSVVEKDLQPLKRQIQAA